MAPDRASILNSLAKAVIEMDTDAAGKLAEEAITMGIDPYIAIMEGLTSGMNRANELFEEEEYFVPELLLCADAMYAGIEILKRHLPKEFTSEKRKVVIGVVKGDTHDIGKNIVKIMLDSGGFEIHDLGRDVPFAKFIDTAGAINADVVCMSTLMTTTMDGMGTIIEELKKAGIQSKTMIGGGPISPSFAKNIGASGYAKSAAEAVKVAKSFFQPVYMSAMLKEPIYVNRKGEGTQGKRI